MALVWGTFEGVSVMIYVIFGVIFALSIWVLFYGVKHWGEALSKGRTYLRW